MARDQRAHSRRSFCWTLAIILVAPRAGIAQTSTVRRIGLLSGGPSPPDAVIRQGFWVPLRDLGWVEGQNLLVERRYADNNAGRLASLAHELVQLNVDIIVTASTDAAVAAKYATTSIPIVMLNAGDPVRTGLVTSLARPGGNITGFAIVAPEADAKLLSLLHEILPSAQRVGVLVNPVNPIHVVRNRENEQTYRSLGMQPIYIEVTTANELDNAIRDVTERQGQALVVLSDTLFVANAAQIMRAALRHALPTAVEGPDMAEAGGLVSYTINVQEQRRRAAALIDKILRGAKPADLPIEQPTKFEIIVNLKTAKALGLAIPQSLLLRADEVIQ